MGALIWSFDDELTFAAPCVIVRPGGEELEFAATWRLLPREEAERLLDPARDMTDLDVCQRLLAGWAIETSAGEAVPYCETNLQILLAREPTAVHGIVGSFGRAHAEAIRGNYAPRPAPGRAAAAATTRPSKPAAS